MVEVLDLIIDGTEDQERISVRDIRTLVSDRSFGPLLVVLGLIGCSPTPASR